MQLAKDKNPGLLVSVLSLVVLTIYALVRMGELKGGGGVGVWSALSSLQGAAIIIAFVSWSMPRWQSYSLSRAVSGRGDRPTQVLKALLPSFYMIAVLLTIDSGLRWVLQGIGPLEPVFWQRRFALLALNGACALSFGLSVAQTRTSGALLLVLTNVALGVGFEISRSIRVEHVAVSAATMYGVPLALGAVGLWRLRMGCPFAREGGQGAPG